MNQYGFSSTRSGKLDVWMEFKSLFQLNYWKPPA